MVSPGVGKPGIKRSHRIKAAVGAAHTLSDNAR
jgi:hypothetical protein